MRSSPSRSGEKRSVQQILHHYRVERELADRLRHSTAEERMRLYGPVYDELFRRVPDHPQLHRKGDGGAARVGMALALLAPFLHRNATFLEVGAGDCAVSFAVAQRVAKVYAVDVSEVVTASADRPANFELRLSDGCSIPAPPASIDIAYSNQLIEHLHPDDALAQTHNVLQALRPGGAYVCTTPHPYTGPHDISLYFDEESTGLHLKEYTYRELANLFRAAGFSRLGLLTGGRGYYVRLPLGPVLGIEAGLAVLPRRARRWLAGHMPLRLPMSAHLVAWR
jgi:SAM-dependent methyltransferase